MNEDKLLLPSVPAEGSKRETNCGKHRAESNPTCEMKMGRSLYIVQCHYIGNETLDDKIERLVLRMGGRSVQEPLKMKGICAILFSHRLVTHYFLLQNLVY